MISRIKPGESARIEVIPPLFCAFQLGQAAHDKLEPKPNLNLVKLACEDLAIVLMVHYSQSLHKNWPCIFQRNGVDLQPTTKSLDDNPRISSYYTFGSMSKVVGYEYTDLYTFSIPQDWVDSATLTYADDYGDHHSLKIDFSVFTRDLMAHR